MLTLAWTLRATPTALRMSHPRGVGLSALQHADGTDGRPGTQACRPPAAQSAATVVPKGAESMGRHIVLAICIAVFLFGCSQQQEKPSTPATFAVVLTMAGEDKLLTIKVVREVTGLGLKDAKDLVESAPVTVMTGLSRTEAETIMAKLRRTGATVKLRKAGTTAEIPPQ